MWKYLVVGGMLAVLTWSGLRVWSARTLEAAIERESEREKEFLQNVRASLGNLPAYQLTFLGARSLKGGDYELAKLALELATKKDRFYRDAFRYYGYALEASGDSEGAELALRRAKTLDPREGQ